MLIDGRTLPDGERLETDLCIIGAGAAGISLALAFADRDVRVCLVESGGFEFEQLVGEPAATIARRASELGCESIVMGTHGLGQLGVLIMGSVAQRVVHQATVPVTLVK